MAGAAAFAALCLAVPATAGAASRPKVTATVSACAGEAMTVSATVDPARARSVRGTKLMLRFQALPLFHDAQTGAWLDLGKAKKTNRSQSFSGLAADLWVGVVRWRFVRGRKTAASGVARSATGRAGGKRGRAGCVLPIGLRPKDLLAPFVALTPNDSAWHRAPLDVRIDAADDLSGVGEVFSRVDGGPLASGRTVTITSEGAHTVEYAARDVAGNTSPTQSATVRVDAGPPSAPVIDFPPAVTGDHTPQVRWSAAADSGSGVRRYFVAVNAADGRPVTTRDVAASGDATQSVDIGSLDAGSYEVQVFAVDGATPEPFVSASEKRGFQVTDQPPRVASSNPADGATLAYSRRNDTLRLTFDREMDPGSVNGSTITLTRANSTAQPAFTVTCSSPCVSADVDPAVPLEGVYTVAASTGVKSAEGAPIEAYSAAFSVNFYDNDFQSACDGFDDPPWLCNGAVLVISNPNRTTLPNSFTSTGPAVPHVAGSKPLEFSFRSTYSEGAGLDAGTAGVSYDGGACQAQVTVPLGSNQSISFSVAPGGGVSTVTPCFVLSLAGGSGASGTSFSVDDLVARRAP